jgi:predicted amidohydrolase
MENTVFIAGTNRVGRENNLKMFGKSKVIDPYGRVQIEGPAYKEHILINKINLNNINRARKELPYLKDFRNDLYYLRQ